MHSQKTIDVAPLEVPLKRDTINFKWARICTTTWVFIVTKNLESLLKLGHARRKGPKTSHTFTLPYLLKFKQCPFRLDRLQIKKKLKVGLEVKIISCFFLVFFYVNDSLRTPHTLFTEPQDTNPNCPSSLPQVNC